jgi:5-dehydro-2-deoxygluconokinase
VLQAQPAPDDPVVAGVIIDDRYGAAVLPALDVLWVARAVEEPGSRPLQFENGASAAALLRSWPAQHVAKCLVSYHPDDAPELRAAQLERLRELAQACANTQRELLLEVIPPGEPDDAVLVRAVADIARAGVLPDWWKLPAPTRAAGWKELEATIRAADPQCRGVLVLGLDAPLDELAPRLAQAARAPLCRGFAVGRTIFGDAARAWFAGTMDDAAVVATIAHRYRQLVGAFSAARREIEPEPDRAAA